MSIISPNMGLVISTIGVDTGFQWETNLNASQYTVDSHNHSPGSGVPITPLGLNISSNLNFQNNSASNIYGLIFSASGTTTATGMLYTAPSTGGGINDLFYNDFAGNVIQLTKAGIVNATASSIPGESYSGGTFTWVQGATSTTPANFDIGSIVLRPNTAGTTNGITLSPPAGISSAYSLALPALPVSQKIMTLDNSGNITAPYSFDNTTIQQSSNVINVINVPNNAITATQIANGTITTTQISASAGIKQSQIAVPAIIAVPVTAYANNTTTYSTIASLTLSMTNTSAGRPVLITAQGFSGGEIALANTGGLATVTAEIIITKQTAGVTLYDSKFSSSGLPATAPAPNLVLPPGILNCVDIINSTDISNGSIVYVIQAKATSSTTQIAVTNVTFRATAL